MCVVCVVVRGGCCVLLCVVGVVCCVCGGCCVVVCVVGVVCVSG